MRGILVVLVVAAIAAAWFVFGLYLVQSHPARSRPRAPANPPPGYHYSPVISVSRPLSPSERERLRADWSAALAAGRPMVLEDGMSFDHVLVRDEDPWSEAEGDERERADRKARADLVVELVAALDDCRRIAVEEGKPPIANLPAFDLFDRIEQTARAAMRKAEVVDG